MAVLCFHRHSRFVPSKTAFSTQLSAVSNFIPFVVGGGARGARLAVGIRPTAMPNSLTVFHCGPLFS